MSITLWCQNPTCRHPTRIAGAVPDICPKCRRLAHWSTERLGPSARHSFTVDDQRLLREIERGGKEAPDNHLGASEDDECA